MEVQKSIVAVGQQDVLKSLWNTKEVLWKALVCYTAVFSVVTQRSCPIDSGEERCKTTPKAAV